MKISYHIGTLTAICVLLTSTAFAQQAGTVKSVKPSTFNPLCIAANVKQDSPDHLTVNFGGKTNIHYAVLGKKISSTTSIASFNLPIGKGNFSFISPRTVILQAMEGPDMWSVDLKSCTRTASKSALEWSCAVQKAHKAKKLITTSRSVCIHGPLLK